MRAQLIKLAHNSGLIQKLVKLAAKPCPCTCKACKGCTGCESKEPDQEEQMGNESAAL